MKNGKLDSIKKIRKYLDEKDISSVELTKKYLSQAKKLNPKTNSYITISEEVALEQAKEADKLIADGKSKMLTGIPFSMKDTYVTKDVQTTSASNVLEDYKPQYSATVYKKLRDQSAVLIGKNNQDAWGHGGSSENTDFSPVHNPWDLDRVAGGSSGGTAAAITSETSVFGIGEDTGGSIRNPSSFCNTTGLKVSYGRVSRYGAIAYASSLDTVGPITNSVEDAAHVLEAIAGFDEHDASSSKKEVSEYSKHLGASLKGKKIGIMKEYMGDGLTEDVREVIEKAAATFEDLGAIVEEVSVPTAKYGVSIYYVLALSETSSNLARYTGLRYGKDRSKFTKESKRRIMLGSFALSSGYYDAYYKKALKARTVLISEFNKAFEQVDTILAPVMPFPAYKFGQMGIGEDYITSMYLADLYTCATNPSGIPSLALPAGFSEEDLPIGMQLMGPMFSEEVLLNVGHQFQQATDYHTKRPKLIISNDQEKTQ